MALGDMQRQGVVNTLGNLWFFTVRANKSCPSCGEPSLMQSSCTNFLQQRLHGIFPAFVKTNDTFSVFLQSSISRKIMAAMSTLLIALNVIRHM